MFGTITNQRSGSSAMPAPISRSLSQCRPEYQVGWTIALLRSSLSVP